MASGRQIQKKGPSNSTPTSATGMFKPRPFAIPAEPEAATAPELQTKAEPGQIGGSRLSRMDFSAPPLIQPKLTIGAPGDKFEREADTIADTVMRMPAVSAPTPVTNPTPQTPLAQAKPIAATITPVASSAQMQLEPLGSAIEEEQGSAKKGRIQRRIRVQAAGDGNLDAPSSLETQLNQTKNSGSPLSPQIRAQMEPRFGADFSGVRVHTDAPAVQMNRALGAQAFTHGNHIYYGAGKSPGNDHLTAHELTHTIQQSGSSVIQRYTNNNNTERKRTARLNDAKFRLSRTYNGGRHESNLADWIDESVKQERPSYWRYPDGLSNQCVKKAETASNSLREVSKFMGEVSRVVDEDLTQPAVFANATRKVLETIQALYRVENELGYALQLLETDNKHYVGRVEWNNTRSFVRTAQTQVKHNIIKYKHDYRDLTNSEMSFDDIKSLAFDQSINSLLVQQVASALESAVPMNGSATLKFKVRIPLPKKLFVDLTLEVEAERRENQFKLQVEALFTGGLDLKVWEFAVSVGFYSEAQADNAYNAIRLISYGFYRKALESSVFPNRLAYALWSGEPHYSGRAKRIADNWEAKLRSEVLDKVEDSYVDTGDVVKGSVDYKKDQLELGLSYKYTSGKKHSTLSYQGESTSKHVVEMKMSVDKIGQVDIKLSTEREETETEISFQTADFSHILKAVIAFAKGLEPSIKRLEGNSKYSGLAKSLWNIKTAAEKVKDAAIPPAASYIKGSQSLKFTLSFTEVFNKSVIPVRPKITKGSLKIMYMDMVGLGRKTEKEGAKYMTLEYETATRLMELTYDNGNWDHGFF